MPADNYFENLMETLRRLARGILRNGRPDCILQTTVLVHEAYLRMSKKDDTCFPDERHFLSYAARTMRSIFLDAVRGPKTVPMPEEFEHLVREFELNVGDLLDLDAALERLEHQDPDLAEIALLKLFTGLTMPEIAAALEKPLRTVEGHWSLARKYLGEILQPQDEDKNRGEGDGHPQD